MNVCNNSSNYCDHSLNDWQKLVKNRHFIRVDGGDKYEYCLLKAASILDLMVKRPYLMNDCIWCW